MPSTYSPSTTRTWSPSRSPPARSPSATCWAPAKSPRVRLATAIECSSGGAGSTPSAPASWSPRRCARASRSEAQPSTAPRGAGALVVGADLCGHRRRVVGVQPFQGPGHPQVGAPALGRAHGLVGDLADPVVGEVVGVGPPVPDDPAPPQLVQVADQGLL